MRRYAFHSTIAAVTAIAVASPFVVVAAPTVTVLGQAEPANPDEAKKSAKEHFDKGVALMQDEQWDAALAEFTASLALFSTKNARKNAAQCLRALGRFDEALSMYEQLLKDFAATLKPEESDSAKKAIAELRGLTGLLVITSNIEGATVVVDGKDRGKTPLAAPIIVASGTRVVRVSKEGYQPFEAKPIVAGKATINIEAKLEALARSGRLRVTEESGKVLEVLVDGAVVGKTPYEGTIAPGQHAVLLKGEGKLGTQPASATIVLDQVTNLRLKAEELGGLSRLEPEPPGASVVLDGVALGQGAWEGALRVGKHKVDVTSEGYFGSTKTFEVGEGKKALVKVTLDRDENSPFWAQGRKRPFSVGLVAGGMFGTSLGGDYEKCPNGECYAHSRPMGFSAALRGGYAFTGLPLGIELTLGYTYIGYNVSRKTSLPAELMKPANVDINDSVTVNGLFTGAVGVSYTFLKAPVVVGAALSVGLMFAQVKDTRTGTIETNETPSPATLTQTAAKEKISKMIFFLTPEVRLALPIGEAFQVGLGVGAMIGFGEAAPEVRSVAAGKHLPPATPGDTPPTIGFVPDPRSAPQTAIGSVFILPQLTLFGKVAF